MSTGKRRIFEPEFKLLVVSRLMAGESPAAVSRELGVRRTQLSKWSGHFRRDGPEGLRRAGRPRRLTAAMPDAPIKTSGQMKDLAGARDRIAELERKVGQQQLELDFFRQALRQVRGARRPNAESGVTGSTQSSKR